MISYSSMTKQRRKIDQTAAGSSSKSNSGFAILPEDLISQIFLLLPVSCLLRVKWVCKSWLSLIESSRFIHQHLDRPHTEETVENKLIIFNLNDVRPFSSHKFISIMDFQVSKNVDFKLNSDKKVSSVNLIASFNGIICLTHDLYVKEVIQVGRDPNPEEDRIFINSITIVSLWNPATKHVKVLPPPIVEDGSITKGGVYRVDYGFGFDSKTNDYKVVRVIVAGIAADTKLLKSHVQVYSLSMDSWRVIDAVVPLKISIFHTPKRPFMNGICCWYGWDYLSNYPAILSFDFSNEVFGTIAMFDDYRGNKVFTFLREKLACINWARYPSDEHENENKNCHCKVWVLEKCGVKESWTNPYSFMLEPLVCPIGFLVNGKMVLKKIVYTGEVKLFLLDPATQELDDIPSQGTISEAAVYKESLVSVQGVNGETYRVDDKWKPFSLTWDLAVSQWIMGSCDSFAGILHDDAGCLVVFNEPKMVTRLPAQTILPTRWLPPLAGTIKLNTDAIMDISTGLGTFGFFARNATGIAVKAICSNPLPMTHISTGKAEAIKFALWVALYAGWDSIVVESDYRNVVDKIKGSIIKGSSDQSSFSSAVTDINILSAQFRSISFCFVRQDLNIAAHTLACHGFTCGMPCVWDNEMPGWLNEVLAKRPYRLRCSR